MFDKIKVFIYLVKKDSFQMIDTRTGVSNFCAIHFALASLTCPYPLTSIVKELKMPGCEEEFFGITNCDEDDSFYAVIPSNQLVNTEVFDELYKIAKSL